MRIFHGEFVDWESYLSQFWRCLRSFLVRFCDAARLEVSLMYMHVGELTKGANSVIIYSVLYLKLVWVCLKREEISEFLLVVYKLG